MEKLITLALILSIFFSGVESVSAFTAQSSKFQVCPTTATLADARLTAANPTDLTAIQVQGVSYYDNGGNDVSQVIYQIIVTPSSNPISWTIILSTLADGGASTVPIDTTFTTTQSTVQPQVLGFFRKTLVLKETSVSSGGITTISYNAFQAGFGAIINLTPPSGKASTQFNLKYVGSRQGSPSTVVTYLQGKSGTSTDLIGFYSYDLNSSTPTPSQMVIGGFTLNAGLLTNKPSPATIVGTPYLYVDPLFQNGAVYQLNIPGGYVLVTGTLAFNIATDLISSFYLKSEVSVLLFVKADRTQGRFAVKTSSSAAGIYDTTVGTTVRIASDNIQNVLIVNSKTINWIYFHTGNSGATTVELSADSTGLDADIYSTDNLRVAGNKAFAFYQTKIVIYKLDTPANIIEAYSTIILNSNYILPSSNFNVRLAVSCQCSVSTLTRMTCFSASLTCIVTANKRWSACSA